MSAAYIENCRSRRRQAISEQREQTLLLNIEQVPACRPPKTRGVIVGGRRDVRRFARTRCKARNCIVHLGLTILGSQGNVR